MRASIAATTTGTVSMHINTTCQETTRESVGPNPPHCLKNNPQLPLSLSSSTKFGITHGNITNERRSKNSQPQIITVLSKIFSFNISVNDFDITEKSKASNVLRKLKRVSFNYDLQSPNLQSSLIVTTQGRPLT